MATLIDIRTRKLQDGRVEAIGITDAVDENDDPVVVRGYGSNPEEAQKDIEQQAALL